MIAPCVVVVAPGNCEAATEPDRSENAACAPVVARPLASTVILVYAPATTPELAKVVAVEPAEVVTSPVNAGICAAATAPDKSENAACAPVVARPVASTV